MAVRLAGRWAEFVVIGRKRLKRLREMHERFGSENETTGELQLRITFRPEGSRCGEVSLDAERNAWHALPPIRFPSPENPPNHS